MSYRRVQNRYNKKEKRSQGNIGYCHIIKSLQGLALEVKSTKDVNTIREYLSIMNPFAKRIAIQYWKSLVS